MRLPPCRLKTCSAVPLLEAGWESEEQRGKGPAARPPPGSAMSTDFDVVVAGGGPAGSAAAIVLARSGRRVFLASSDVDGFAWARRSPPAVRPLLRDLGVLDRFLADGHVTCPGNVAIWGTDEPVATDFIFDPYGQGWHLDRARFDTSLRDAARDADTEISPARLVGAVRDGAARHVALAGGKRGGNELLDRLAYRRHRPAGHGRPDGRRRPPP